MREETIEKHLKDLCKANNIYIMKVVPTVTNGLPDRLLLYKGFAIFVELKQPGERPRVKQWHEIKTLNKYSNALYLDTIELVDELIETLITCNCKTHTSLHKLLLDKFKDQMIKPVKGNNKCNNL